MSAERTVQRVQQWLGGQNTQLIRLTASESNLKNHVVLFSAAALISASSALHADQFTVLGTSSTYAVLATSTTTNTGTSVITGDLGLSPGTSVTGLLPTDVSGAMHVADSAAEQARTDAQAAYVYLGNLAVTDTLTGQDLGGKTLGPGVYLFATTAALTGNLTLDFNNLNDAVIVFLVGTSFGTSSGSTISVINQGRNDNVYYRIGTSATLGESSSLSGDILAGASISFGSTANIPCGSAMALGGAVTMISNTINNCSATGSNVTRFASVDTPPPSATPEPSSFLLLATGVFGAAGAVRRNRSA